MKKILAITIPTICVLSVVIIILFTFIIPKQKHKNAVEKYGEDFVEKFENLQLGDYINLGKYEQDGNRSNGTEDVEWLVLDKQDNKVLLISKYVLDREDFSEANNTWDDSHIRSWMNETFYNDAFDLKEKSLIKMTYNEGEYNGGDFSENSEDWLFALSVDEVKKYFQTEESRKCTCTSFAKYLATEDDMLSEWWLRSPGTKDLNAAYVAKSGYIDVVGCYVAEGYFYTKKSVRTIGEGEWEREAEDILQIEVHIGFRPAMWVSIYD